MLQQLLCLVGLGLSLYALHVEHEASVNISYKAACDFNEVVSCSKVFTSRWGKGFGLVGLVLGDDHDLNFPNSIFGILFYTCYLISTFLSQRIFKQLALLASVLACCGCAYLAYILVFVLEDICIVCVSTYVVNFTLCLLSFLEVRASGKGKSKKQ